MTPRLLAISGPLPGAEFPLDSGEVTIGREPLSEIRLEHPSVSRRHCTLGVQDGHYTIADLASRNGTFVNRVPVKQRKLEDGDQIRIGEYEFLFLTRAPAAVVQAPASPDESEPMTHSILLKREDSLYLTPSRLSGEIERDDRARASRIARDLKALLAAGEAMHSLRGAGAIARQLLQSASEVTPAKRGVVILFDDNETDLGSSFGWERSPGATSVNHSYQALIDQVKKDRVAVLREDPRLSGPALLAAPLVAFDRILGAI